MEYRTNSMENTPNETSRARTMDFEIGNVPYIEKTLPHVV
jgi:hypothetical protein